MITSPLRFLLLSFLFCLNFYSSEAQPAFQRTYAMGSQNEGKAAVIAANHDLYFAGTTNDNNLSQTNIYLVCTDSAGNFRWQRSYGGGGVEQGTGITLLPDQSLLLGGFSNSFNFTSDYDGYLLHIDSAGDTLWTRQVGSSAWDFITTQAPGLGDTIIFAGYSYGNPASQALPWIIKVLPDGTVADSRLLPLGEDCFVNKIRILQDGRILLGGYYGDGPYQPTDAWLGLCDASMDTIWNRRIDYGDAEQICALDVFPNEDILFAGRLTLSSNGFDQNMIGRIDQSGTIAWTNIAGGDSTYDGYDDVFIRNDTLFGGATTSSFGQGGRDFQLITFDGAGQFIIGKTYGGQENDQVRSCIPGEYGGVILTGYSNSFPVNQQTLFVVRTDSSLESTNNTVVDIPKTPAPSFKLFPNPVGSHGIVQLQAELPIRRVVLSDVAGKALRSYEPLNLNFELNLLDLPAGVYYLTIILDEQHRVVRKLVIGSAY